MVREFVPTDEPVSSVLQNRYTLTSIPRVLSLAPGRRQASPVPCNVLSKLLANDKQFDSIQISCELPTFWLNNPKQRHTLRPRALALRVADTHTALLAQRTAEVILHRDQPSFIAYQECTSALGFYHKALMSHLEQCLLYSGSRQN